MKAKSDSGSNGNGKKNNMQNGNSLDIEENFHLVYENMKEIDRLNQSLRQSANETREFYMDPIEGNTVTFAVMSNNHSGNISFDAEATKSFVNFAAKNGADYIIHGGDILDGIKMYRNQKFEQYATDVDEQIKDFMQHYPRKRGLKTYFICGDHDLSFNKVLKETDDDLDIGKKIQRYRSDFIHLGDSISTINFPLNVGKTDLKCLVIHPSGNPAYALSYKTQKTIESLTGGEKPGILLDNQYHTAEYIPNYRDVDGFQTACFSDQTSFMKSKHAPAHVGGFLIKSSISKVGNDLVKSTIPIYKAFYSKGPAKESNIDEIVNLRKSVSKISDKIERLKTSYESASKEGNKRKVSQIKSKLHEMGAYQDGIISQMRNHLSDLSKKRGDIYVDPVDGNDITFGLLGDSHFGHECDSQEYHEHAYEVFDKLGIKKVFHTGDLLDGYGMHPGQEFEQYAKGFDEQLGAMLEKYPKAGGIDTYFICGNHDMSFTKKNNVNVGKMIRLVRPDMHHIGDGVGEYEFILKNGRKIKVRLEHPSGGTAYALSYRPQKIGESIPHSDKPDVLAIGHYHKLEVMPHYRNQQTIQTGCMQDQTPFMKSKAISANTGFWVVRNSYGDQTNELRTFAIPIDKSRVFDIDSYIESAKEALY